MQYVRTVASVVCPLPMTTTLEVGKKSRVAKTRSRNESGLTLPSSGHAYGMPLKSNVSAHKHPR